MPLRITDAQKDVSSLNKWAKGMEDDVTRLHHESRAHFRTQNALAASVAATAVSSALPANPTGTSGSSAAITIDGQVYCQVTINYTAPATLGSFGGVFLAVKNYNGSTQLVKASEDNFTGAGGGSQLFKTILNRTGEVITCYVVPKTIGEATVADWTTAPNFTLTLDGSVTAPAAPSGLAVTAQPLANTLAWTGNSEGNMQAYTVYRNTVNVFGSAAKLGTVPWVANGVPHFVDKTGTVGTTYYYFITATNNATLESGASASANVTVIAANLDTHVVNGATFLRGTAGSLSYRPTTNPLTGHDAGGSASVPVGAHTMRYADLDAAISSGTVTGLAYGTNYHLYYDDLTRVGGAVSFVATTVRATALQGAGRHYVGSVLTPLAAGLDTLGNNDGGIGGQQGKDGQIAPQVGTVTISGGVGVSVVLPGACRDGSLTTKTTLNNKDNGTTTSARLDLNVFSDPPVVFSTATLKIKNQVTNAGIAPQLINALSYSLDGGTTFNTIFTTTVTRALTTDTVALAQSQKLGNIVVRAFASIVAPVSDLNTTQFDIYEVWIEVAS